MWSCHHLFLPQTWQIEAKLKQHFWNPEHIRDCVSTEWRYVAISSGTMMDFQNKSEFISIIATALATSIHSVPSKLTSCSVAVFEPGRAPSCLAKRSAARLQPSSPLQGSRCPSSGSPLHFKGLYWHAHGRRPDLHLFSLHHVTCKSEKQVFAL